MVSHSFLQNIKRLHEERNEFSNAGLSEDDLTLVKSLRTFSSICQNIVVSSRLTSSSDIFLSIPSYDSLECDVCFISLSDCLAFYLHKQLLFLFNVYLLKKETLVVLIVHRALDVNRDL